MRDVAKGVFEPLHLINIQGKILPFILRTVFFEAFHLVKFGEIFINSWMVFVNVFR